MAFIHVFSPTILLFVLSTLTIAVVGHSTKHRPEQSGFELDFLQHQQRIAPCGGNCGLRLCNFNGTALDLPNAAFTILNAPLSSSFPFICDRNRSIGQVLESGEARVFTGTDSEGEIFEDISAWRPEGLRRRFDANFISTTKIPFFPYSGISRQRTRRNQWQFLHDRCMILPVNKYETIDGTTGLTTGEVDISGRGDNCVAFRTTAPAIQVELIWDSKDDFDLSVLEPNGNTINFENLRGQNGRLIMDNNVDSCETDLSAGRENVLYFPDGVVESGNYTATVTHYRKCTRSSTWRLRISLNGALVTTRFGLSDAGEREMIASVPFVYP